MDAKTAIMTVVLGVIVTISSALLLDVIKEKAKAS